MHKQQIFTSPVFGTVLLHYLAKIENLQMLSILTYKTTRLTHLYRTTESVNYLWFRDEKYFKRNGYSTDEVAPHIRHISLIYMLA